MPVNKTYWTKEQKIAFAQKEQKRYSAWKKQNAERLKAKKEQLKNG